MGCSLSVSWLNDQQIQDNQTWILFNNFCLSVLKTIIVEYAKWTEKMQIKRHLFSNNWQIWYRNLLVICRHVTIKDLKSKMLLLLLLQLNTNIEMLLLTDDKFRSKLYYWWPFKTSSRKTKYAFEYILFQNRLRVSIH